MSFQGADIQLFCRVQVHLHSWARLRLPSKFLYPLQLACARGHSRAMSHSMRCMSGWRSSSSDRRSARVGSRHVQAGSSSPAQASAPAAPVQVPSAAAAAVSQPPASQPQAIDCKFLPAWPMHYAHLWDSRIMKVQTRTSWPLGTLALN